jgi:hypothetical protein
MIRVRQGLRWLPILFGGVGAGCGLALTARLQGSASGAGLSTIVTVLPFVLAVVTGVAKTTTA